MKTEAKRCPCCGQKEKPEWREIALYKGLVVALDQIYRWCKEKGIHEFRMADIRHLINQVDYSRLNDLVRIGGLLYRPDGEAKRGYYGMNMERVHDFLSGKTTVPERVWKSSKGNGIRPEGSITARQVKGAAEYLDEQGIYKAEYRESL